MTDLEQRANDEARHGNREALEQMTARLAEVERERDRIKAKERERCLNIAETYGYPEAIAAAIREDKT